MSDTRRVEYTVFIPDDAVPEKRRAVGRYQETEGDESGAKVALEHVAWLHQLAAEKPSDMRRGEAFAVMGVITISETPLVASSTPREDQG